MSGMNLNRERALGYDDDYRSTEFTRHIDWCVANASDWSPGRYVVPRTNMLVVRQPNSIVEFEAVADCDALFRRVFSVNYRRIK